jgi:phage shock protein A
MADLGDHEARERQRIEVEVDQYIEDMKRQLAPDLEESLSQVTKRTNELGSKVDLLQKRVNDLESQTVILADAVEVLNLPDRGILEKASTILNQYTVGVIVLLTISMFTSLATFVVILFRR